MKNSNWIVSDIENKKQDIISHIKATTERATESRILAIASLRAMPRESLMLAWSSIPATFKNSNKPHSLGCA